MDLAVLKINVGKPLPVLSLGDSEQVKVGNWVIAIGNPYGLERPVDIGQRSYKNLLQTDASINPGNSGGPLLNLSGEVVGINTAINAEGQGLGFAISTSTVNSVLEDLISNGKVVRPWLGVQLQTLNSEIANYLGLEKTAGVLLVGIVPNSPAERAGLQRGDVILKIDKQQVTTVEDITNILKKVKVNQKLVLLIHRDKLDYNVSITVNEKPSQ